MKLLRETFFFSLLALVAQRSECQCKTSHKTYKVGEVWSTGDGLKKYTCLEDGSFNITKCEQLKEPEEENSMEMEGVVPGLDIVPDVLDKMPADFLEIMYENETKVNKGRELTPTQVKAEPTVHFEADPASWYLLCMVDPDAPSRQDPKFREILHWLVGNIPGNSVPAGEVMAGYRGSGAPQGTGLHRYAFFVYKQPGKLNFDEPRVSSTSRKNRFNFSLRKFAKKYNLGDAIAFNAFQAQWDEYVPILQQLTDPE